MSAGPADPDREETYLRGLVRAAAAVRAARDLPGILAACREGLSAAGLCSALFEHRQGQLRFVFADDPFAEAAKVLHERHGRFIPLEAFPLAQALARDAGGIWVEDLGAFLGQLLRRPRAGLLVGDLAAVATGIFADEAPAFGLVAAAPHLGRAAASALALFGKQVGSAVEASRRLDDLAQRNRELLALNHVVRASATLGSGRGLKEALERIADAAAAEAVAIFRREEDQLVLAAQQGFPEAWVAAASRVSLAEGSPWARAVAGGELIAFDLAPAASRAPRQDGHDSVAIPLRVTGDVNGVLVAARPDRPFAEGELRLLVSVAAQIAVSLQNFLLFQQTQRRVGELSLLLELGQAVSSSLEAGEVLAAGARVAARVLRCSAAWVLLVDAPSASLKAAAIEDPAFFDVSRIIIPLDEPSITALAFQTGRPQLTSDAQQDDRVAPKVAQRFSARAALAVPLLSRDRTLGVLTLVDRTGERVFDTQDVRLASHAAQLLAASIENADLFARERRRAEEMAVLFEVSQSLRGSLEVEPLARAAAAALGKLLGSDRCYVMLWDAQARGLRCLAAPPEHARFMAGLLVPESEPSHAMRALRERRTIQIDDVAASPDSSPKLRSLLRYNALLAVPMFARDEPLGALLVESGPQRTFSAAEVERATAVAGQLSLAVLSARLYQDLRDSYLELGRAQNELVDRERLAALGELSASIAHEVRNPLAVIFNAVHGLRKLLRPNGQVEALLGIVAEEADRLNRMVSDLLDYSRPLKPALFPVRLAPLVRDALEAARPRSEGSAAGAFSEGIAAQVRVAEDLFVSADHRLLRQALVNLFLNSFQAIPRPGGLLRVSAARAEGKDHARILVEDNGPGIPAEVRSRIFQPFFTTKPTGTGLGLAVVKRIVDGHGGSIELAGKEGGACFQLVLPLATPP